MDYTNDSLCNEETLGAQRDSLYIVIPITILYVIIFLTGTIGNISTCIVIARNKSMHTATNYYLFSLAVSDILLLVSGLPQEIYLIWYRYPYIFGSTFCFLRGLFSETSANATVLVITAFTVERYLAICHPFLSHTMSKLSRAIKFILAIWLIAVCLAIPQSIPFKLMGPCPQCLPGEPLIEHSFELSTFLFFVAPMTLISVLYILIGMKLKTSNMMKKRTNSARAQSKSSRKVIKMLVAVVVAFFICWAPFHAQRLFAIYSETPKPGDKNFNAYLKIYETVTYASGVLYYISATVNPILYNILSVKFREAFKDTFAVCCLSRRRTKPCRQYSALSRSNPRDPNSTDSGREDTTLSTHKNNSTESAGAGAQSNQNRWKTASSSSARCQNVLVNNSTWKNQETNVHTTQRPPLDSTLSITSTIASPSSSRINRLFQIFECLTKKTIDQEMQRTENEDRERRMRICDISNSSLKDIEQGALEDELTAYMKELQKRDLFG